jgi:hypothetical protein
MKKQILLISFVILMICGHDAIAFDKASANCTLSKSAAGLFIEVSNSMDGFNGKFELAISDHTLVLTNIRACSVIKITNKNFIALEYETYTEGTKREDKGYNHSYEVFMAEGTLSSMASFKSVFVTTLGKMSKDESSFTSPAVSIKWNLEKDGAITIELTDLEAKGKAPVTYLYSFNEGRKSFLLDLSKLREDLSE